MVVRGVRQNEGETSLQVSEEWEVGGVPSARAKIPLQPMERTTIRQPMEVNSGVEIHLQPM